MKILNVVQLLYAKGGIEQLVLSMLKNEKAPSFVCVLQGSEDFTLKAMPSLYHYKDKLFFANLDSQGKRKTVGFLRALCKELSITAIHTHYTGPLLYTTVATTGLNTLTHVHTEHDSWHLHAWKNFLIEKTLFSYKKNLQLVAISKQIQDKLSQFFPTKKTHLIHNGIDTTVFKPGDKQSARAVFNLPTSSTLIGCAGSLLPMKGHQYAILALLQLPEDFHLTIAGSGPLFEELRQLTQYLKLEKRVHLLGSVEDMSSFYKACDLFCHPSLNEGLPLALLEAQSTDLVCVCSQVGGCSEAIDPNSGHLIEPANPKAIAHACLLAYQRGGNPREFICTRFSHEQMMTRYNQLYRGIDNVNAI